MLRGRGPSGRSSVSACGVPRPCRGSTPRIPRGNCRERRGRRGREEPPRPRAWRSVPPARHPRGTGTCRGGSRWSGMNRPRP